MSAEQILKPRRRYTPEEYLTLEHGAEFRSEYMDGEIWAMAGGSSYHTLLIANVNKEAGRQLVETDCLVFTSDTKVKTGSLTSYFYPDLTVVCGEPQFFSERDGILMNPKVIFEVLSPSTEAFDRGEKFARYRQIESLTDYVLISQKEPLVEHYARQDQDIWVMTKVQGLDAVLSLPSIGCTLKLSALYHRITFSFEEE